MGLSRGAVLSIVIMKEGQPMRLADKGEKGDTELISIHPRDCIRSSVTIQCQVKLKIKLLK